MAGPSILVRVLADITSLGKSFEKAESKAVSAAKGIHEGFSEALDALNKTGVLGAFGDSLDTVNEAVGHVIDHVKEIGPALAGVGTGLVAAGVGLQTLGSKDKAAHQQLQAAVAATGHSYDTYEKQVEAAIKTQEKFGYSADQTQDALRILTQATNDPAKALQYLSTASDLAASSHESLTAAATQLGKTYNGSTKLLKQFGVAAGTTAKQATSALEKATTAATSADEKAVAAKQKLADLQGRLDGGNKVAAVSTAGVTAAQDRLAKSEEHLSDLEAVDAGKKKLTISQQLALQHAHEAVTRAVGAVTAAQSKYSQEQTAANSKGKLTVAQQQQLRDAEAKVSATAATARAAHQNLAAAQAAAGKAAHTQGDEMTSLSQKLHGQASAAADTFAGHIDAIKAHLEDVASTFGQKYGPAIETAGKVMAGFGAVLTTTKAISEAFTTAKKTETAATEAATVATDAATVSEGLALGPILLIILAIAALGAAAYLIYRNWNTIWKGMKAAVLDVWNWIKSNWPYLLGILLGPIALAAAAIYKNWDSIKTGAKAVLGWFETTWTTVTGYITAPFVAAWQAIARGWDSVVGAIAGLPGRIASAASGMWNGILAAFRGMVNGIIDIWNGLHFQLPKVNVGPIHIGGETIGVPHIPHLAQGGLITRSGIVYAHAGEAITPAPGRSGPAVVVQNASFNSAVDVETFMRKAAWVVQTQRI